MKRKRPRYESEPPARNGRREPLSTTPELATEIDKHRAAYRGLRTEIEKRLAQDKHVKGYLDKLERAGAKREAVVFYVATEVKGKLPPHAQRRWTTQREARIADMRRRNRKLRGLARQLESIAGEVEKTYGDTWNHPDLIMLLWGFARDEHVIPASERIPRETIAGMRNCVRNLRAKATDFGNLSKASFAALERRPVQFLLGCIHQATGDARRHLGTICEMLNAAYHIYGLKKCVSSDALEKTLVRHVVPRPQHG